MMRTTTFAAALLLAAAPLALAQPAPPPPPGGPGMQERGDGPGRGDRGRDDRERGERGDRDRDRDRGERHGRGDRGERGGPPHGRGGDGASFRLDMGPLGSLTVRCGEESLSDCVEAARPLLGAATGATMTLPEPLAAPDIVPLPPVAADDGLAIDVPPPAEGADGTELPDSLTGGEDAGGPPIETLEEGLPDGPDEETPVIDGLEGGAEPGPAN